MRERYLRAIAFAIFATLGLMVGGFILGYGAALLSTPSQDPVVLPTLVPTPQGTPVEMSGVDSSRAGAGDPGADMDTTPGPVTPSPAPSPGIAPPITEVELSLETVDLNNAQGGIEIVILLHNRTDREINLSFWPEDDLVLTDDQGRRYPLRWAEYDGIVIAPAGGSLRLVRAFFDGLPVESVEHLTVRVKHPPQLRENSWQVPLTP